MLLNGLQQQEQPGSQSWGQDHHAHVSPGASDAAEHQLPHAVQAGQQQDGPVHTLRGAGVCGRGRQDICATLGE